MCDKKHCELCDRPSMKWYDTLILVSIVVVLAGATLLHIGVF